MPVGPPNRWLLNTMVELTNKTLTIIEKGNEKILANILNNDNTISGANTFTGDNVFTGDNTFTGNGNFNTLEAIDIESQTIESQSVSLNTINYLPLVYEVDWISNDINGIFTITYSNDTLQLTIINPDVHPYATNPTEYLVSATGIADINDIVGSTLTLTNYTNSNILGELNPLSNTFTIISINTDTDFILAIQLDTSLPITSYSFGDHTIEGTINLTSLINSNEVNVTTNLNLSENNISANLGNFTNVVIDGNLSGNTQLNIEGNLLINGQTTFNGNIISNNTLNIESNVSINNSLTVNDASTFNETLNIKNGGINVTGDSSLIGNVRITGNLNIDGAQIYGSIERITANVNTILLNANIRDSGLGITPTAGFIIETHSSSIPSGYLLWDLSADRFWDLSGDNLSGNILQANTLRANTIGSSGTDKITFNNNIEVPLLVGNVSGNTATFSGNVTVETGGYFIGDGSKLTKLNDNLTGWLDASFGYVDVSGNLTVLSSLNGNSATFTANVRASNFIGDLSGNVTGHVSGTVFSLSNFTTSNVNFGNVTAKNFFGNLQGNITGSQHVYVTSEQFIIDSDSYLLNTLDIQSLSGKTGSVTAGGITIIDSEGNVTAKNFFGNLNGDILADGDISISNNNTGNIIMTGNNIIMTGNINLTPGLFGNISMSKAPKITSIVGNLAGSGTIITGNMNDSTSGHNWYPLMYNPTSKELRFGPPPYP